MDMLFSYKTKYHYTYPNTYMFPALLPHFICVLSGMTSLGVRRRSSQWKGESKGVVVKLTRDGNNFLFLCVCVLEVTLAYEKYSAIYVFG